jgi:hypothetical protein
MSDAKRMADEANRLGQQAQEQMLSLALCFPQPESRTGSSCDGAPIHRGRVSAQYAVSQSRDERFSKPQRYPPSSIETKRMT